MIVKGNLSYFTTMLLSDTQIFSRFFVFIYIAASIATTKFTDSAPPPSMTPKPNDSVTVQAKTSVSYIFSGLSKPIHPRLGPRRL